MIVERRRDESSDQFPVGMRVLAVDDNPTCLRYLEVLLRKCQYHVTTTSQAITALKLLRENKNYFDLVISDVDMPDMDGFKLLELVGLEMDLPVIMLSGNGDTKLVMQGITHGACDYLLKPVRVEELKTIWQHVVRRRHLESRDRNSSNAKDRSCSGEGNRMRIVNSDSDVKLGKKRKDQDCDDEDNEQDENEHENEDPSSQKKPRVVWSVELHRKFVSAVNQLGLDKAVPKKILELMNVDKLTRENVASHLQKYRLYLKRLSSVANQHQANMVPPLVGMNHPVSFNFSGSAQFQNNHNALRPTISPAGVHTRLNTSAGLGLHGLLSSGLAQPGLLPVDNSGTLLQGATLTPLEFDQFQHNKKGSIGTQELYASHNSQAIFNVSRNFSDTVGSSSSLLTLPSSSLNSDTTNWPIAQVGPPVNPDVSDSRLETQSQGGLMSENVITQNNKLDSLSQTDPLMMIAQGGSYPFSHGEDLKSASAGLYTNTVSGPMGFESLATEQGRSSGYNNGIYMNGSEAGFLEDVVNAMFGSV